MTKFVESELHVVASQELEQELAEASEKDTPEKDIRELLEDENS